MKKKIYDIVFAAQYEGLTTKEATDQLLVLFGVVARSEQLSCSTCIDYGNLTGTQKCLGCVDYKNWRAN